MHQVLHALPAFLEFLALCLAVGALGCWLWVLPVRLPAPTVYTLERLLFWSLLGLGSGALLTLMVRTAGMSGRPIAELGPVLPRVLLETHFGTIWMIRACAILLLYSTWYATKRWQGHRDLRPLMAAALAVIAWTHSAAGHAADQGDFTWAQCIDGLHILAASMWAGSLLAFTLAGRGDFLQNTLSGTAGPAVMAQRLSRLAAIALGGVLVTGLVNASRQLGAPAALWGTVYGTILLVKLALVLAMINLGAVNRYIHLPRLKALEHGAEQPSANILALRYRFIRIVALEAFLVLGVLLCATLLIHEPPPRWGM
ncbi:MAG: copper resistance D family protein [Gammaproteobacteria bacterium]